MTPARAAAEIDLARVLRRGDRIVIGQACGEPTTLVEALISQGGAIGELSAFIASSFSGLFTQAAADSISISSMGAIGALRDLTRSHRLGVVPCHVGQVGPMIEEGAIGCDVAFVQVSPADAKGRHSLGLIADHVQAAIGKARCVVAEINDQVPATFGPSISSGEIDFAVAVSRAPVEVAAAPIGEVDAAIAGHAAGFVDDGSVIQIGIGAAPDAILRLLHDRRDLGVHSGMMGDGLADLVEAGVVTNARKSFDRGVSITGALIGTRRLYEFADRNPSIRMCSAEHTHGAAILAQIERLATINSALEVDLTGQVNAEQSGAVYLGGTGGQADFVRAGGRSPGGRSIIALPATARNGSISRIVSTLSGPVTTMRADVDVIVTEFGAAELKGRTLAERARRMVAIAHPDFRETLSEAAFEIQKRGF